jgi:hypothetical protein
MLSCDIDVLVVFAELAFVNVKFASGQFWVLVAVDFVMLVMRDVSSCLRASKLPR